MNQPRNVVDSFIHTEESRYLHPFKFCVIGTLFFLVINLFIVDFTFESEPLQIDGDNEQLIELAVCMNDATVSASTQFLPLSMFLLLIPMLSLPGLFFFRDELEGFYSNLILNSYTVGASMSVFLVLIPLWTLLDLPFTDPFMNTTLPAIIIGAAGLWIYKRYFNSSDITGWIRIFSSFISGYILFILVKGLAAGIVGYMLFAVNRIMEISGG
jgi:hypothetical protein